jgi:hypothetical protein
MRQETRDKHRRRCEHCQRLFTCDSAYHLHRIGRRSDRNGVRCRTDEEMLAIKMQQKPDGAWMARSPTAKPIGDVPPGHRGPFA